jgi:hypothetical protein
LARFPENTVILEVGRMRHASDLGGRHVVRVDAESAWRHDLADRLHEAGCDVDRSGREWLTVGDFEEALRARPGPSEAAEHAPTPGDQERLDRLLGTLSRPAMRALGSHDFGAAWPDGLTWPARVFVEELEGIEQNFDDPSLDELRVSLRVAAEDFLETEAANGFPAQVGTGRRNTGWASGELEGDQERYAIAEARRQEIHEAATRFMTAHDDLVRAARQRGYGLQALERPAPVPPWHSDPFRAASRLQEVWQERHRNESEKRE